MSFTENKKHIFVKDGGAAAYCQRCGEERRFNLPMPIHEYVEVTRAFVRHHRCPKSIFTDLSLKAAEELKAEP